MNSIKRILGIAWIIIAVVAIVTLIFSAVHNISAGGKGDISKPVPWLIIIIIFTPSAIGLIIFGWYAWKGEYDGEIKT